MREPGDLESIHNKNLSALDGTSAIWQLAGCVVNLTFTVRLACTWAHLGADNILPPRSNHSFVLHDLPVIIEILGVAITAEAFWLS